MSFLTTPDGARLRVCDRGRGEQSIVLVHGWKGSHRLWDPAIYRLARDFRVVAFDNRGMGESDLPAGRYDFDVLASDLRFVLDSLDVREATLVGWSMGCSISLEYLERFGDRAAKLVLMNGPICLRSAPDFPWGIAPEWLRSSLEDLVDRWPEAELDFAREAAREPESAYADLYYRVALQTPLEASMAIVEEQAGLDHRPLLPRLELPVLALYGQHDPYYDPALARYIAEHVPDGRAMIFDGSAHSPHYDEPDRFRDVIADFADKQ